jgi:hypothetical protein
MSIRNRVVQNGEKLTPQLFAQYAKETQIELISEFDGLKVGDKVTFTNENKVVFKNHIIVGIDKNDFHGRRFFLNKDSFWFPVRRESLTLEG